MRLAGAGDVGMGGGPSTDSLCQTAFWHFTGVGVAVACERTLSVKNASYRARGSSLLVSLVARMWGVIAVDSTDVHADCSASVEVGHLWVELLLVVARGEDSGARTCAGEEWRTIYIPWDFVSELVQSGSWREKDGKVPWGSRT